jgi:hypothetical protein
MNAMKNFTQHSPSPRSELDTGILQYDAGMENNCNENGDVVQR